MAREGGAYRPASLSGTYSRVPHEVIAEAHRLGMPNVWAVLLMLLSYTGEDSGGSGRVARAPRCATFWG